MQECLNVKLRSKKIDYFLVIILVLLPVLSSLIHWVFVNPQNSRIEADVLVAEGWLPEPFLSEIVAEYARENYQLILTTGLEFDMKYRLYSNSVLVFTLNKTPELRDENDINLKIQATGSYGGDLKSAMNVWLNDSIAGTCLVDKKLSVYTLKINNSIPDSIGIEFINDTLFANKDRNLFIKEVYLGKLPISGISTIKIDRMPWDGKNIQNDFAPSFADNFKEHLIVLGVSDEKIIPVSVKYSKRNRTYKSALGLKKYIHNSGSNIKSINVVTLSAHSRRTYYTMKSVLGNNVQIGIIPLQDTNQYVPFIEGVKTDLREWIAFTYYVNFLLPFHRIKSLF